MRTSSTSRSPSVAIPTRRAPQQARATLRREKFLDVAAHLFDQLGYEAVTMTAVADQAEASIGTLYDYFPDKPALALALKMKYAAESDEHWQAVLAGPLPSNKSALAELFATSSIAFVEQRPGYLALAAAPVTYTRSNAAREPVRKIFASALKQINPKLTPERAMIGAQVMVQLVKGLLEVYRHASPKDRDGIAAEFKELINLYLGKMLK